MTDAEADPDAGRRVLRDPTPEAAVAAVEAAIDRGHAVSLLGPCLVPGADDAGDDTAGAARRHVLVKPDGSVVVHGGTGATPIRRDGPGPDLAVTRAGDRLRLVTGAGERLVEFARVDLLVRFPLDARDGAGSREEAHASLRERLLAEPDLVEPGFRPRSTERETDAGPVDLFGRDAEGRAVVVEVKTRRAGPAAAGQLDRYVSALRRDLHAGAEVRGVLVAPSATERTRRLLDERGFELRVLPVDG